MVVADVVLLLFFVVAAAVASVAVAVAFADVVVGDVSDVGN